MNPLINSIYIGPGSESNVGSIINGITNEIIATFEQHTSEVGVNMVTNRWYSAISGTLNGVSVFDGVTNVRIATISVGELPFYMAVGQYQNQIYAGTVSIIDSVDKRPSIRSPWPAAHPLSTSTLLSVSSPISRSDANTHHYKPHSTNSLERMKTI